MPVPNDLRNLVLSLRTFLFSHIHIFTNNLTFRFRIFPFSHTPILPLTLFLIISFTLLPIISSPHFPIISEAWSATYSNRGLWQSTPWKIIAKVESQGAVAQTHCSPFDGLRANGGVLKSYHFSVHAELVEAWNGFGQQLVKI